MDTYQPLGFGSDIGNPMFAGAQNPDSLMHVEFYWHEPEDPNKSLEQGKMVRGPKTQYVRIQRPGDKNSVMESAVREEHKRRWPDKWLYWQIQEGLIQGQGEIPGWKLEEWDLLNKEQIHELKYLRFATVEQIAGASDAQVQRIGMNGLGLREQAKQALRARMGAETRDALDKKDAELNEMRERLAKLEALLVPNAAQQVPEPATAGATPQATTPVEPDTTGEREAVIAAYAVKFGKKPHHKLSLDKIKAALA